MAAFLSDKTPHKEEENAGKAQSAETVQPGYLGLTPPPGLLPEKTKRAWVDRPEQLLQAAGVLKQARIVAVDAEFTQIRSHIQGDTRTPAHRLALLQLAIERDCYVVDALRLNDLSPLVEVVANPDIIVLLHGAGSDMRVMAERGLDVAHYYDLEAASRSIFGQQESSLAAMLRRAFNFRMDKSLQRTDWTRRPLPPAMVAYAARDAEMTLALYFWMKEHYAWALQLHKYTNHIEPVAAWIEPFLRGASNVSAEAALADAKANSIIQDDEQVAADFRTALASLTHPMHRSRLLRLIADLPLPQLAQDIEPLLQAPAADERAASARALGRLGVQEAQAMLQTLLQDPVQDVRKAAQTALRNLSGKETRAPSPPSKIVDGARRWTIGESNSSDDDSDWKARLRAMMGESD
jgi:3'-5' exonuclease/HEAT repeats